MPCIALVEYALGLDLPDYVINHQSLKDCREVAIDLVLLYVQLTLLGLGKLTTFDRDNDILSYKKDMVRINFPNPCTSSDILRGVFRSKAKSSPSLASSMHKAGLCKAPWTRPAVC